MNIEEFSTNVVSRLKSNLPEGREFIALHEPTFEGNEWNYLKECLDSGWVSSVGKYVDLFEQKVSAFTGTNHAVAVMNGTAALHICLKLADVQQQDEVLVPSLTFVATANAISYCGAIPHFVDISHQTLGLDPYVLSDYLESISEIRSGACYNKKTGRRIKAVVPMHTFGHSVDLDPLVILCEKYGLELVEDAAESLGSYYKGRHTGSFGRTAAISFNGNKIITTGGGGAIVTNDESIARKAKHLTTTSKIAHPWEYDHDHIGYNYRMPNINAALGCAQLEKLPELLHKKRDLAARYHIAFADMDGIQVFREPDFSSSNYWLNTLILDRKYAAARDIILNDSNKNGIMTRPVWKLLHKLSIYEHCPKMNTPVADDLEKRIINIPSSANCL
ncbi:LegC family aminotransferase [Paenibacillus sepulcri]|uniref:LegC family aminotransferase n=1 Tax=Paenibacillus sepulcri TaxID=359917 RepID=A0ABS7BV44_9BACL|nr:LegC family aminotransferase [Paenibacillus sepulcri]